MSAALKTDSLEFASTADADRMESGLRADLAEAQRELAGIGERRSRLSLAIARGDEAALAVADELDAEEKRLTRLVASQKAALDQVEAAGQPLRDAEAEEGHRQKCRDVIKLVADFLKLSKSSDDALSIVKSNAAKQAEIARQIVASGLGGDYLTNYIANPNARYAPAFAAADFGMFVPALSTTRRSTLFEQDAECIRLPGAVERAARGE